MHYRKKEKQHSAYISANVMLLNVGCCIKLYLSAWGMHDRSRGRRRSSRNLLVDPERQTDYIYIYTHTETKSFLAVRFYVTFG